jgi:hypothetical protein
LAEKIVLIENFDPQELHGVNNTILNKIKLIFPKLKIIARGNEIKAIGEAQEVDDFVTKVKILIQPQDFLTNEYKSQLHKTKTFSASTTAGVIRYCCRFNE